MNVDTKRKEIILFVMSVVILSGIISLLSNILFTEFYDKHRIKLILFVFLTLMITLYIIIKVIFMYGYKTFNTNMLFVYDTNEKKFIDIPYNPASVNARALFENLRKKDKEKIKINGILEDSILENKNIKEFYEFCNCLVVQLIFGKFLKNHYYDNYIDRNDLKELIVNFRYIDVDLILGKGNEQEIDISSILDDDNNQEVLNSNKKLIIAPLKLALPKGFKIKELEKNSMKLNSMYGFLNFNWNVSLKGGCGEKTDLLSLTKDLDLKKCMEVEIQLNMKYGFKPLKVFNYSTIEFEKFINNCTERMKKFDKSTAINEFEIEMLSKIFKYIDN